jgi:hypothetical protein
MNKAILSLFGCSGSIAMVLATSTIANPDPAQTVPYPEVMNLQRVPIFDANGIVPLTQIASNISPRRDRSRMKVKPQAMTIDLVSQTVREAVIKNNRQNKYGCDCPGCRNLAPSVMVLGYSSIGSPGYPRTTMY